jgi:hypothetical protein
MDVELLLVSLGQVWAMNAVWHVMAMLEGDLARLLLDAGEKVSTNGSLPGFRSVETPSGQRGVHRNMSANQASLVLPFIELVQFLVHVFTSANKGQTGISPRPLMITMGFHCDRWPRLFFLRLDGDFALKFDTTIVWSALVGTLTSVTRHCCPMLEVTLTP